LDRRLGSPPWIAASAICVPTHPAHAGILILRVDDQSAATARAALMNVAASRGLSELAGTVAVAQRGPLRVRRPR
jgi:hypothetical protein